MISSTTWVAARVDRNVTPMREKHIFFIVSGGHHSWPSVGRNREAWSHLTPLILLGGSTSDQWWNRAPRRPRWRQSGARSGSPYQRQSGRIINHGSMAHKLADCPKNGGTHLLGARRLVVPQAILYPLQSEFGVYDFVVFSFAFHHPARNQQQGGAPLHCDDGRFRGGMGEKTKRQTGGSDFHDSSAVAEKSRSVAGIAIAERAQLFVVTAKECGTGTDTISSLHDAAVEGEAKFGHGVGLIGFRWREETRAEAAKCLLCCGQNGLVILSPASHVEQAKQDPFGADAQRVVQVASYSLAVESSCNFGVLDLGELAWDGLHYWG